MEPRVVKYTPQPNPYYAAPSGNRYFVPNPFGTNYVVPACPGAHDWMNSRYYHEIKNRALKSRYQFARKNCMRKGMSMASRYECFKLHWKQYKPGSKNTIHQVRDRVQRDCMKYRYNPRLRRMCFKAHVRHYQTKLLAQQEDNEDEEQQQNDDMLTDSDVSASEKEDTLVGGHMLTDSDVSAEEEEEKI
jgi:hypothetical protein